MSDQNDVFSNPKEQTPGDPQQKENSQVDIFADQLKMIKNESGEQKYDSVPKALEGLAHAQAFIPQLKTELQAKEAELEALKQKLEGTASMEDIVARLTAQKQEPKEEQAATPAQEPTGALDEKAVLELVQRYQQQSEAQKAADNNVKQVTDSLTAKFGEKTQDAIQSKATELGVTTDYIKELAKTSPKMVLSLFGTTAKVPAPTTNSIKTSLDVPNPEPLERPSKSLLSGATSKEQAEYMERIKRDVYERLGITS